jgi:hypothetical protein
VNADYPLADQKRSLTHEIGHLAFGEGHPSQLSHLGYGGIMDYKRQRVSFDDRARFRKKYHPN